MLTAPLAAHIAATGMPAYIDTPHDCWYLFCAGARRAVGLDTIPHDVLARSDGDERAGFRIIAGGPAGDAQAARMVMG